jgi:hypothetical protein
MPIKRFGLVKIVQLGQSDAALLFPAATQNESMFIVLPHVIAEISVLYSAALKAPALTHVAVIADGAAHFNHLNIPLWILSFQPESGWFPGSETVGVLGFCRSCSSTHFSISLTNTSMPYFINLSKTNLVTAPITLPLLAR